METDWASVRMMSWWWYCWMPSQMLRMRRWIVMRMRLTLVAALAL